MTKPKPRLVYSSEVSQTANLGRDAWGFEHARQLSLFEYEEDFSLHIIAIGNYKFHSFQSYLRATKPRFILDTRCYPSFFSIFESYSKAISEFQKNDVIYDRVPIDWGVMSDHNLRWELKDSLTSKLEEIQRSMCVDARSSILLVQSEHVKSQAFKFLYPIIEQNSDWNLVSA